MPTTAAAAGNDRKQLANASPKPPIDRAPAKFTYALKQWSVERRETGWFVGQTVPSFAGNKTEWRGPFATIESACLAIARGVAVELADRHTRSVEAHHIGRKHPLYGFKPETRLNARGNGSTV